MQSGSGPPRLVSSRIALLKHSPELPPVQVPVSAACGPQPTYRTAAAVSKGVGYGGGFNLGAGSGRTAATSADSAKRTQLLAVEKAACLRVLLELVRAADTGPVTVCLVAPARRSAHRVTSCAPANRCWITAR